MKARHTLVFRKLHRQMANATEAIIADEIIAAALNASVKHVIKKIYLMKVRFSDDLSTKNTKEKGIYLFNLYIVPW